MDIRDFSGVWTDKIPGSRIEYNPFPGGFKIIPGLVRTLLVEDCFLERANTNQVPRKRKKKSQLGLSLWLRYSTAFRNQTISIKRQNWLVCPKEPKSSSYISYLQFLFSIATLTKTRQRPGLALHCWQLAKTCNICSVYGDSGSSAYYSL